jgi:hypothetical protein
VAGAGTGRLGEMMTFQLAYSTDSTNLNAWTWMTPTPYEKGGWTGWDALQTHWPYPVYDPSNGRLYFYYAGASTKQFADETDFQIGLFEAFDFYNELQGGTTLNTDKWTVTQTGTNALVSQGRGICRLFVENIDDREAKIIGKVALSDPCVLHYRARYRRDSPGSGNGSYIREGLIDAGMTNRVSAYKDAATSAFYTGKNGTYDVHAETFVYDPTWKDYEFRWDAAHVEYLIDEVEAHDCVVTANIPTVDLYPHFQLCGLTAGTRESWLELHHVFVRKWSKGTEPTFNSAEIIESNFMTMGHIVFQDPGIM